MSSGTKLSLLNPNAALIERVYHRKFAIITIAGIAGLLIHIGFIYLFHIIGAELLSKINYLSVVLWLIAILLNLRGRHSLSIYIMWFEIVAHATLATYCLGFSAGFQYYLWPLACLTVITPSLPTRITGPLGWSCIWIFTGLYLLWGDKPYEFNYPEYIKTIYMINAISAGTPLVIAIMKVREIYENQEKTLTDIATRDMLTGLYNRRYLIEFLDHSIARFERTGESFVVAMGDIDNFKQINDTYGHDIGDQVLKDSGNYFLSSLRKNDCVCRWGGEELLILLPDSNAKNSFQLIERLRKGLSDNVKIDHPDAPTITISFGIAQYEGESAKQFIKEIDQLLYQAKDSGKNMTQSKTESSL